MKKNDEEESWDLIANFIESNFDADHVTTAYIVVSTVENFVTGEQRFFQIAPPQQVSSVTIGLLESASAAEKHRFAKTVTQEE
jgi:hypothetical protein